jgi:hypothetical protein
LGEELVSLEDGPVKLTVTGCHCLRVPVTDPEAEATVATIVISAATAKAAATERLSKRKRLFWITGLTCPSPPVCPLTEWSLCPLASILGLVKETLFSSLHPLW